MGIGKMEIRRSADGRTLFYLFWLIKYDKSQWKFSSFKMWDVCFGILLCGKFFPKIV